MSPELARDKARMVLSTLRAAAEVLSVIPEGAGISLVSSMPAEVLRALAELVGEELQRWPYGPPGSRGVIEAVDWWHLGVRLSAQVLAKDEERAGVGT